MGVVVYDVDCEDRESEIDNGAHELAANYEANGDTYRAVAYRRAIDRIQTLSRKIRTTDIVAGARITAKIREFLTTGCISDLERMRKDSAAMRILTGIIGVGPETAHKWIAAGIRTLPQLRRAVAHGLLELTHMQKYGLRYYTDLTLPIPRTEVAAIGAAVQAALVTRTSDDLFEIVGSYRRGAETSGDVDIIMVGTVTGIDRLDGFIDFLSFGPSRATFLMKYRHVRQVDILCVPRDEFAASLLYFTGSADFNQRMRGIAKSRGYRLSQHGLKRSDGTIVPTATERDIFQTIGMEYVEPALRVS